AINRFLAFKACVDCDGRTAQFYRAMLGIYFTMAAGLGILLCIVIPLAPPSSLLGFSEIPAFDVALLVMTVGMLLTLPANPVSGLYRV
ncbi:hypothetical protein ACQJ0S_26410, partial [Klebsiella pneumoniae]|uniref:hypothetical protein n=1 Tax=Klebsiella pneumoniae TaxID=573 RepID=UPI003D0596AA